MSMPAILVDYLSSPSTAVIWSRIRDRLERTGHRIDGSVRVELDAHAADRLAGLLGRPVVAGTRTVGLLELDAAFLRSSAGCGLVPAIAALTGGPLRDRPSERHARKETLAALWSAVEQTLHDTGLDAHPWSRRWLDWLHRSGLLVRAGAGGVAEFSIAARALSAALGNPYSRRMLGELASAAAGNAHALDLDRLAGRLAVRGLSLALDRPDPASPRERSELWHLVGITVDAVSGTVITWGLRPPGSDAWSRMMHARADLGLVTHLTLAELATAAGPLTTPGITVAACENPQVLQRAAEAAVPNPLVCFSGNPSSAGSLLAERLHLRYHGDFDWPGVAIAARLHATGAEMWRMGALDYLAATRSIEHGLALSGSPVPTPWDADLSAAMTRIGIAVHEESVLATLIADLSITS